MNLENIERLLKLMQQYDLGELQVEEKDLKFQARRGDKPQAPIVMSAPQLAMQAAGQATAQSAAAPQPAALSKNSKEITAPIVGTFYRSPAPDQLPFKEVGDRVNADDVVCIIEAMKVMNEIKAGVSGTIKKILIENATPVEFGQALFLVEVG